MLLLSYIGLAVYGLSSFLIFTGLGNSLSGALSRLSQIKNVKLDVQPVRGAGPLDVDPLLREIKTHVQGASYLNAKRILKEKLSHQDWVAKTWMAFHYPESISITLVPKYVWGYVYLEKEKSYFAMTLEGKLLETAVVPSKVSAIEQQLYIQGQKPQTPLLITLRDQYESLNQTLSKFGLSVSQYMLDASGNANVYVSNGIRLISPEFFPSPVISKVDQVMSFFNQKHSVINSIQFISSKKVVVSFAR